MTTTLVLFQHEQHFLENVTSDADILTVLKGKNILPGELSKGLVMVQTAKNAFAKRETLFGAQMKATEWLTTELRDLRVEMSTLYVAARTELKERPDLLKTVGLKELKHGGGRKPKSEDAKGASDAQRANGAEADLTIRPKEPAAAISEADKEKMLDAEEAARKAREEAKVATEKAKETGGSQTEPSAKEKKKRNRESRAIVKFVGESEAFLKAALGSKEILDALAAGSYQQSDLEALSARVEALRKANVAQDEAVGRTEAATVDLLNAKASFKKWFTPRRRRVLRALRKFPELVKRLGQAA